MTKEELEKEAYQFLIQATKDKKLFYFGGNLEEILADFAEPREKRIEELEKKLTEKVTLESLDVVSRKIAELEEAKANLEYLLEGRDNEIDELKKENKVLAQNLEDTEICENGWKNRVKELEAQIEKMKKYIKACWVEENLNDYSSYITNTSDEFRDLVKELNDEVRNGR